MQSARDQKLRYSTDVGSSFHTVNSIKVVVLCQRAIPFKVDATIHQSDCSILADKVIELAGLKPSGPSLSPHSLGA